MAECPANTLQHTTERRSTVRIGVRMSITPPTTGIIIGTETTTGTGIITVNAIARITMTGSTIIDKTLLKDRCKSLHLACSPGGGLAGGRQTKFIDLEP